MLRPGDILEDKYRIIELIGRGGMSKVWRARDTNKRLAREWAVKEISKTSEVYKKTVNERKALHEIEIMKELDHPALPRILDVIDGPASICVVMDYIQGVTLQGVLDEYGPQKEEAVVSWMLEVCDILSYLHSKNPPIIYRDIKPSNLMINSDGHIKIIDFGIARENVGDDTMPLGSEGFASPEHFTGKADERSDIYTVGSTAYCLLTGKNQKMPPYYIEPIRKHVPTLSQGLEKVILKATEKNPDDRYQTAGELANAFESYRKLDDEYISGLEKEVKSHRRKIAGAAAVIVLGAALTAAGFIYEMTSYKTLVASPGGKTETKVASYEKALEIKPGGEEAYLGLIDAYAEDGKFTEEESEQFFSIYNANRSYISPDTSYRIGEAYLRFYTGKTDSSARAKLITAEPFFNAAKDGDNEKLAESYVFLAEYYKTYVTADDSLLTGGETERDYAGMLKTCEESIKNASNEKIKLIVEEASLGLIESQRARMKETGIEEAAIKKVIDLCKKSEDMEIASLALDTEKNVERTYHPKGENDG